MNKKRNFRIEIFNLPLLVTKNCSNNYKFRLDHNMLHGLYAVYKFQEKTETY